MARGWVLVTAPCCQAKRVGLTYAKLRCCPPEGLHTLGTGGAWAAWAAGPLEGPPSSDASEGEAPACQRMALAMACSAELEVTHEGIKSRGVWQRGESAAMGAPVTPEPSSPATPPMPPVPPTPPVPEVGQVAWGRQWGRQVVWGRQADGVGQAVGSHFGAAVKARGRAAALWVEWEAWVAICSTHQHFQ